MVPCGDKAVVAVFEELLAERYASSGGTNRDRRRSSAGVLGSARSSGAGLLLAAATALWCLREAGRPRSSF